ncbi:MAG: type II secretion system protein [Candidatus Moraniibacteriota bacterium]|jgi:prepilin-type N-terminal cleavage/methylation domain-containing protein
MFCKRNNKTNKNRGEKKGFTLIELLIVIAIIGVLASIIMVVVRNVRVRAKDASFRSTAGSIKSAGILCCEGGLIQDKLSSEGDDISICDDTSLIDEPYPGNTKVGNVTVQVQCDPEGHFEFVITPGIENLGSCESIIYDETGELSNVGCN